MFLIGAVVMHNPFHFFSINYFAIACPKALRNDETCACLLDNASSNGISP